MNANCASAKYWFLVCRFCAKYWCLLCRFCAKVLVLASPLLCQSTGACFAAFVPKYWSFACCLCAILPVPSLLPLIVVACPNYRWLCFRCMPMYRAVAWLINWRLYELWCTSTHPRRPLYASCVNVPGIVEICCDLQSPKFLWSNPPGFRPLECKLWWTALVERGRGSNAFACQ